jgi:hypothetical protein
MAATFGRWIGVGGLLLASGAAALWFAPRSAFLMEWVSGFESAAFVRASQARKNDRLPRPDPVAAAAQRDADFVQRVGRPPIDAIWAARMTLPSPADWVRQSSPPAPVDPQAPLAYAAARASEPAERDPFRVIDDGRGTSAPPRASGSAESIPIPLPRPQAEAESDEEEEEEEAEVIPLPIPRPRNIPPAATVAANAPLPPARGGPTALIGPAAAPPAAARPAAVEAPTPRSAPAATQLPPAGGRVQLAALGGAERQIESGAAPQTAPRIMTPFGVPFTLQHASVETSCFPPALVELLRRLEAQYGRKPVVTSGYRTRGRGGSLHRRCMAADILVPGVSADSLARTARNVPGMGGVGIYCHESLVHVDIGTPRDWRYGCGSFFALRDGSVARGRLPANYATSSR